MAAVPPVHVPNELRYRRDRVRLTVLVFRKEGMSTEEFQKYWRDQHSQCFAHLKIVKKNLLKYEQVGVMMMVMMMTDAHGPCVIPPSADLHALDTLMRQSP